GIGIEHHGADGNPQGGVVAAGAVLVLAAPVLAIPGAVQARIAEVDQGVDVAVGNGVHIAATTAVPAVRAALGDEFFAAKPRHAVAALAGKDFDGGFVYEFQRSGSGKAYEYFKAVTPARPAGRVPECLETQKPCLSAGLCVACQCGAPRLPQPDQALTVDTVCLRSGPRIENCTRPSSSANRV